MEIVALLISIMALAASGYLLWKQHLKPFNLWAQFQSAIFDGSEYGRQGFHIILPITVANEGAKPGTISHWALYMRRMDDPSKVFVFHGMGLVDVKSLIHSLRTEDFKDAKILESGNPLVRLSPGEQRDLGVVFILPNSASYHKKPEDQGFTPIKQLTLGKYNLELRCFVDCWKLYHKVGLDLNERKIESIQNRLGFVNNFVPAFDLLKPDIPLKPEEAEGTP